MLVHGCAHPVAGDTFQPRIDETSREEVPLFKVAQLKSIVKHSSSATAPASPGSARNPTFAGPHALIGQRTSRASLALGVKRVPRAAQNLHASRDARTDG